jgi:hypothetical protein
VVEKIFSRFGESTFVRAARARATRGQKHFSKTLRLLSEKFNSMSASNNKRGRGDGGGGGGGLKRGNVDDEFADAWGEAAVDDGSESVDGDDVLDPVAQRERDARTREIVTRTAVGDGLWRAGVFVEQVLLDKLERTFDEQADREVRRAFTREEPPPPVEIAREPEPADVLIRLRILTPRGTMLRTHVLEDLYTWLTYSNRDPCGTGTFEQDDLDHVWRRECERTKNPKLSRLVAHKKQDTTDYEATLSGHVMEDYKPSTGGGGGGGGHPSVGGGGGGGGSASASRTTRETKVSSTAPRSSAFVSAASSDEEMARRLQAEEYEAVALAAAAVQAARSRAATASASSSSRAFAPTGRQPPPPPHPQPASTSRPRSTPATNEAALWVAETAPRASSAARIPSDSRLLSAHQRTPLPFLLPPMSPLPPTRRLSRDSTPPLA